MYYPTDSKEKYPDPVTAGFKIRDSNLSNTQKRWLEVASKFAANSTCRSKHAAIVVKNGRPLAIALNKSRLCNSYVNWTEDTPCPSWHAEEAVLRKCRGMDLTGAVIYIARVNKSGGQMSSAPCFRCQRAIANAGIKKICYTVNNSMEIE